MMWLLIFTFLGLSVCCFVILVFGLVRAGRRADEGEERIASILTSSNDKLMYKEQASWSISEVSMGRN
jgi:hypothetical protein